MSTRAERINSIIAKRHPLGARIKAVENHLDELQASLGGLIQTCSAVRSDVETDERPRLETLLSQLDKLNTQALSRRIELTKLRARFERSTLNVGVIGRARVGKSKLLQSLSGLTQAEIPDGGMEHCTGVRSTILCRSGPTYANVHFHSESSLLNEVLTPYFDQLDLTPVPTSLDDFVGRLLPTLSETKKEAVQAEKYRHLEKYHKHCNSYRHLLRQSGSPVQIDRAQIREYVAQDDARGNRAYFNWLAVREVEIFCPFPHPDIDKLSLIDMPGLGDTGIGDEERLIGVLGEDVDWVLFVRKPAPTGDFWGDVDVKLYDTANRALRQRLPIDRWSFMVLNQPAPSDTLGDNRRICESLRKDLANKSWSFTRTTVVDCANQEDVRTEILDPLIAHLLGHIEDLDRQYAGRCQESVLTLQQEVDSVIEDAKRILGKSSDRSSGYPLFVRLFDEVWQDLNSGMHEFLKSLWEARNKPDNDYRRAVNHVLSQARRNPELPSASDVKKRADLPPGGVNPAYDHFLSSVRASLSRKFLSIDESLQTTIGNAKASVAAILRQEGRFPKTCFPEDGEKLLSDVAHFLENDTANFENIACGFRVLSGFTISYRGLIQHRMRRHLNRLDPDSTSKLPLSKSPTPDEVAQVIEAAYMETLADIQSALQELECEPSLATFSMIEEFFDRTLRAQGVHQEWSIFYERLRADIWKSDFKRLAEKTQQQEKINSAMARVVANSSTTCFQFT